MINSDLFSDDIFMELDDVTRLVWIGLIVMSADDQGRLQDNELLIKSQIFPMDNKSPDKIKSSLDILEGHGMIYRYKSGNKKLIQIVNWWKHQAPSWAAASLYPAPDGWTDRVKVNSKGNKVLMENWTEQGGFMEVPTKVPTQVPTQVPTSAGAEVPDQVVFKVKVKDKIKVKLTEEEEDARAKKIADILNSYFDEIGNITPIIKSEITEMLDSGVPHEWFGLAFRECAANDVRTWAYARAIIVRWLSDGKVSDNRANGSGKRKRRDTTNSGNDIEAFRALFREQQEQRKGLV
jgi:DNA replication protein DnaD